MYRESFGAAASTALAPSQSERARSILSGGSGGLYSTVPGTPVGRADGGWPRPGRGYREAVSHHLEPIPGHGDEDLRAFDGDDEEPIRRSAWWRWVAIIVALAMVIATPFAYLLSILLR